MNERILDTTSTESQYSHQTVLVAGFDGHIRLATSGFTQYSGFSPDKVMGLPLSQFVAGSQRDDIMRRWSAIAHAVHDEPTNNFELRTTFQHRDGQTFPVHLHLTPVMDHDEFVVVVEDRDENLAHARIAALETVIKAVSSLNVQEVLETTLRLVTPLVNCDRAMILAADGHYQVAHSKDGTPIDITLDPDRLERLQQEQQPIIIDDRPTKTSWLGIPLLYHDNFLGTITFETATERAFTSADAQAAMSFAEEAAVALHNAQMHMDAQRHAERRRVINDVALAISRLDLEGILRVVYEKISELIDTTFFFVGLYDSDAAQIELKHFYDNGERMPDQVIEADVDSSISGWVISHRQPLIAGDIQRDDLPSSLKLIGVEPRSVVFMPLIVQKEIVGLMSVQSHVPDQFSQYDVELLESIASPIAAAIRNAQLFDSVQRRLNEVSALHQLSQTVTAAQEIGTILHLVVNSVRDIFQSLNCTIALREADIVRISASAGLERIDREQWLVGEGAFGYVVQDAATLYLPDTRQTTIIYQQLDLAARSLLAVPLLVNEIAIGALVIESDRPYAFTPHHERVLIIMAAQVAAAIENARLLEESQQRAAMLQQLNQLRVELVDNVIHELRSPLSFVRGYAELMTAEHLGPITAEQADALEVMNRKTEAMLRLINDILEMERIRPDTLQLQIEDICDLLRQTAKGAQLAYSDKDIEIALDIPDKPIDVKMDRVRIEQVVNNLIGNAVKYSPGGGTITVKCKPSENNVCVSITDQGMGMPAEDLARIFERFYRVPGVTEDGVGIGLAIVKQIIDAHGGSIHVESEVGKGSTFAFSLPCQEGQWHS